MNVTPTYSNIGQVFNNESFFIVPKYQRPYSWEEEQIKDFFNDIRLCYNNETDHFLGAIVTISEKLSGTNKSLYEVIDGQQRLTTVSLFAFALLNHYIDIQKKLEILSNSCEMTLNCNDLLESINVSIQELRDQYVQLKFTYKGKIEKKLKLTPSNSDSGYYTAFILDIDNPEKSYHSNEKIDHAYKQLYKSIDDLIKYDDLDNNSITLELISEKFDKLNKIIHIMNDKIYLLNITTENRSDAYKLFQTLNNRGLNLNVADLLKARTLEMLDGYSDHQNIIEKIWIELSDSPNVVEFLKCAYFYETASNPNKTDLYNDLLNQFFKDNIKTETDVTNLCHKMLNLKLLFSKYEKIINGEWPYSCDDESKITDWQKNRLYIIIKKLKHKQCIPLLLYAANDSEENFFKYVHLTERFFFKCKSIYSLHGGKLTKFYNLVFRNINKNVTYNFQNFKKDVITFSTKEMPEEKFDDNINMNLHYKSNGSNIDLKYLFSLINDYYDYCNNCIKSTQYVALSSDCYQIIDFNLISIEHISAQNGSDNFDKKQIHKLGNLTLLSRNLNTKLANSDYSKKKNKIIETQLKINSYFKTIDTWNNESFTIRHNLIISYCKNLFDLNK